MKKMCLLISVVMMTFFLISVVCSGTAMAQKKSVTLRLVVPCTGWGLAYDV